MAFRPFSANMTCYYPAFPRTGPGKSCLGHPIRSKSNKDQVSLAVISIGRVGSTASATTENSERGCYDSGRYYRRSLNYRPRCTNINNYMGTF
jgi:hypothetical protein